MNDNLDDDMIICDECELEVDSEDELYPFEDMNVCSKCHDKLKLIYEQEVIEWETEEYGDYD